MTDFHEVIYIFLLISLCFVVIPLKIDENESMVNNFEIFVQKYNKSYRYDPSEYELRFHVYQKTMKSIKKMNLMRTTSECAKYGETEFSDMTKDEFSRLKLVNQISWNAIGGRKKKINKLKWKRSYINVNDLPLKVDWREKGVISPVRNQGSCGACWANSVIETIESMKSINKNMSSVEKLSVQQMIDCAENLNFGCNGGDTCNLLEWLVMEKVYIATEEEYPRSSDGWFSACQTNHIQNLGVRVHNYTCNNFALKEAEILQYLAHHGPVTVAVNALSWQNYLGGIIQHHCYNGISSLNHAVQIVGYDRSESVKYYIVRNSWGENFGNDGYLKIQIGKNLCGIGNEVSIVNIVND